MEKEILTVPQTSVAQALAMDYFCIYYVNTENDKFIEYSSSPEYRELGLPRAGDDLLTFARSSFEEIIYPEDRDRFLEMFTKERVIGALDERGYYTLTFRMMFRETPVYVHLKATRMVEKEGHHVVIGISSVDEQMKALDAFEKAHHASVTYSRIAQALAEDYFCIYYVDMSTDHFIEYSSDSAYKELGIERDGDDFFGRSRVNIRRVMYEEDRGAFLAVFTKENIQRVLDEHRTFTLSYRLLMGGRPVYVSLKATRMKDEDGDHIIIGVNNIDAQMRQQQEYRQSEEERITYSRVAQALAGDYFSIYVVDPDTDQFIEYSSTEEYEKLGIEKAGDDFFGTSRRNMERLIYEEDHDRFMGTFTKEKIMSILERDGSFTMKYRLVFGNEPVYISMKATLLEDRDGRHLIIGSNNIDAQMKREAEYRRRMAEARTSARNDFLANMSHDIRTPMNAIVGYTNIARNLRDDKAAVMDALDKISSSSHFLLSLINDILDISKIESGRMQLSMGECDLSDIFRRIEDITALQAKDKDLSITYQHDSIRHFRVHADELRIEQVLINIISNAIKYTPEGGKVDLIAGEEPAATAGRYRYRFIVRDTGIGISEDYLPHIFESFTREEKTTVNRIQGTGLGLAITARVVDLMGGTISVKSRQGEGSEFTVVLELEPLEETAAVKKADTAGEETAAAKKTDTAGEETAAAKKADTAGEETAAAKKADTAGEETAAVKKADTAGEGSLAGRRVLIVEDHAVNAEIARMILMQYGVESEWAENGKAGVARLQEKGRGYYDAILMDIQMPVMNGYEAARAIRALEGGYYRTVPIIAMSANAYDEDVKACLEAGMNAHIAKPFQPEWLERTLQKWMI